MTDNKVIEAPFSVSRAETSDPSDRRKPCIALMGEFSAGKTTLINFLIGEDVLPTKVTATQVPPVWLSHGEGAPYYVDSEHEKHALDLTDIQDMSVDDVRYIKIFSDSEILEVFDLIDTPGISDPNIPEFHRDTAIDNADLVIWCTHATQAWRASEKSTWDEMPEKLHRHSILLATRADKLDERNCERVKRRLMREAGDKFGSIIMFSATNALKAKAGEGPDDLMEQCGGAELLDTLQMAAGEIADMPPASDGEMADTSEAAEAIPLRPVRPVRVERKASADHTREIVDEAESQKPVQAQSADSEVAETEVADAEVDEPGGEAAFVLNKDYLYSGDAAAVADAEGVFEEDDGAAEQPLEETAEHSLEEELRMSEAELLEEQEVEPTPDLEDYAEDDDYAEDVEGADDSSINDSILSRLSSLDRPTENGDLDIALQDVDSASENIADTSDSGHGTARALWEQTLAEQDVESVADVLEAIGRFVDVLDQHGAFSEIYIRASAAAKAEDEDEDSGWRLTS